MDELSTQHRHHLAENAALAECQTLIQEAAKGWTATAGAAEAASEAALAQAGQEYMHAATRHLYYQRALLQLLLRQLTFCVNELQGMLQSIFGTVTSFAILLAASVCMDHNASHALRASQSMSKPILESLQHCSKILILCVLKRSVQEH